VSQEDVELVQALFAAPASMGRAELLEALPALIEQGCDPEIEWSEDPGRPDGTVRRGHAGVRESFERWLEDFDEFHGEIDEIVDCGDNVLVIAREIGRGAASGAEVSAAIHMVLTFRAGKLLRYREFYDLAAAREAAGPPTGP
jgi:ketosteroid isomerase-like protein